MKTQTSSVLLRAVTLAVLVTTATSAWAVPNVSPGIIPIGAHAYGKSYGEWAAAWWTWGLTTPFSTSQITDPDGRYAAVSQSGPVWFLAGNFGGTTVRNVTVPAGRALFFPIVNTFSGFLPFEEVDLPAARQFCKDSIDSAADLACEIDGRSVVNLTSYREQTPVFRVTLPADNLFDPAFGGMAIDPMVDEGIYLLLAPLTPGQHTIHWHGYLGSFDFELDVTYHLTVQ
ncbi:MAG TPA: hypothetical protein VNU68_18685 [Verrucomicrobiae bacterium]|nr:hypothetical protein [Verrucomicrobiae bacterium]